MEEEKCGTYLKLNKVILDKFLEDVKDRNVYERVIYTKEVEGYDLFGDPDTYYKVLTLDGLGVVRSYTSENLTSNKWYKIML